MSMPAPAQQERSWERRSGTKWTAGPLGLVGYKILITGGSDQTGTPARKSLPGAGRRKLLLAEGVGFHPVMEGERKRKMIRAHQITPEFVQVNARVTAYGEKSLDEMFPKTEKAEGEKKADKPKERKARKVNSPGQYFFLVVVF